MTLCLNTKQAIASVGSRQIFEEIKKLGLKPIRKAHRQVVYDFVDFSKAYEKWKNNESVQH